MGAAYSCMSCEGEPVEAAQQDHQKRIRPLNTHSRPSKPVFNAKRTPLAAPPRPTGDVSTSIRVQTPEEKQEHLAAQLQQLADSRAAMRLTSPRNDYDARSQGADNRSQGADVRSQRSFEAKEDLLSYSSSAVAAGFEFPPLHIAADSSARLMTLSEDEPLRPSAASKLLAAVNLATPVPASAGGALTIGARPYSQDNASLGSPGGGPGGNSGPRFVRPADPLRYSDVPGEHDIRVVDRPLQVVPLSGDADALGTHEERERKREIRLLNNALSQLQQDQQFAKANTGMGILSKPSSRTVCLRTHIPEKRSPGEKRHLYNRGSYEKEMELMAHSVSFLKAIRKAVKGSTPNYAWLRDAFHAYIPLIPEFFYPFDNQPARYREVLKLIDTSSPEAKERAAADAASAAAGEEVKSKMDSDEYPPWELSCLCLLIRKPHTFTPTETAEIEAVEKLLTNLPEKDSPAGLAIPKELRDVQRNLYAIAIARSKVYDKVSMWMLKDVVVKRGEECPYWKKVIKTSSSPSNSGGENDPSLVNCVFSLSVLDQDTQEVEKELNLKTSSGAASADILRIWLESLQLLVDTVKIVSASSGKLPRYRLSHSENPNREGREKLDFQGALTGYDKALSASMRVVSRRTTPTSRFKT